MKAKVPRGLYVITSEALCNDPERLLSATSAALRGGAVMIQYRDKWNTAAVRERLARALLEVCQAHAVPLIINDDLELAATMGADGVHLGAGDGSIADARVRLGAGAIIGATCADSLQRAQRAQAAGASYLAFGALFPSSTKPQASPAKLSTLTTARELGLPVCAIGGITQERAASAVAAGADLIAVVEGVFGAADVEAAARAYRRAIDGAGERIA